VSFAVCFLMASYLLTYLIIIIIIQASLPVRDGGLGVRRVSSLALPAFLASPASTLSLQDDILTESALPIPTATFYSLVWRSCQPNLVMFQICYRLNSHSETALACSNPKLKWRPVWRQHTIGHHSWQLHANTVEIGCLRCPSPHAD